MLIINYEFGYLINYYIINMHVCQLIFINIHKYGTISAASVVVALGEAVEEGRIKKGDKIALVVFGAPAGVGMSLIFAHLAHGGAAPADLMNNRAIVSFAWAIKLWY